VEQDISTSQYGLPGRRVSRSLDDYIQRYSPLTMTYNEKTKEVFPFIGQEIFSILKVEG